MTVHLSFARSFAEAVANALHLVAKLGLDQALEHCEAEAGADAELAGLLRDGLLVLVRFAEEHGAGPWQTWAAEGR